MTVQADDLRKLLGSDADDAQLVLEEGRTMVVPAAAMGEHPGAVVIVTKPILQARLGDDVDNDTALEQQAAMLDSGISNLGA
jgi:hypothetical protein